MPQKILIAITHQIVQNTLESLFSNGFLYLMSVKIKLMVSSNIRKGKIKQNLSSAKTKQSI